MDSLGFLYIVSCYQQIVIVLLLPFQFRYLLFFKLFIYLFIYLFLAVLGLCFRARAFSSCGKRGHSSSQCVGLSLSRPLLLRSTGSRRAGSVVVAHRPSCSAACRIFPDQGLNPCALHWQADSQPLCHQGSPYSLCFKVYLVWYEYSYACFLFVSVFMEYLTPFLHFLSVCALISKVSLLQAVYKWVSFFPHWVTLRLLIGEFNPFTFKVIIGRYVFIVILLIGFWLFL